MGRKHESHVSMFWKSANTLSVCIKSHPNQSGTDRLCLLLRTTAVTVDFGLNWTDQGWENHVCHQRGEEKKKKRRRRTNLSGRQHFFLCRCSNFFLSNRALSLSSLSVCFCGSFLPALSAFFLPLSQLLSFQQLSLSLFLFSYSFIQNFIYLFIFLTAFFQQLSLSLI